MRKFVSGLCLFLILSFPTVSIADDFFIHLFDVFTHIQENNDSYTGASFNIRDNDDNGFSVVPDVVDSVKITDPDGWVYSYSKANQDIWRYKIYSSDLVTTDKNKDGSIDLWDDSFQVRMHIEGAWEVEFPTPHKAGTYEIEVICDDGQTLSATAMQGAGLTLSEFPPPTNISAGFNTDGLFEITWELQSGFTYPSQAYTQIRIERYESDGGYSHLRHVIDRLPPNSTKYTLLKAMSDNLRYGVNPYVKIQVRIYSEHWEEVPIALDRVFTTAKSDKKDFKIDGDSVIPTTIIYIANSNPLNKVYSLFEEVKINYEAFDCVLNYEKCQKFQENIDQIQTLIDEAEQLHTTGEDLKSMSLYIKALKHAEKTNERIKNI